MEKTHIAPNATMHTARTFERRSKLLFKIIMIGRATRTQSDTTLIAEWVYVKSDMIRPGMQVFPVSKVFQKSDIGLHWNIAMKKKTMPYTMFTIMTRRMIIMCVRSSATLRIKAPSANLRKVVVETYPSSDPQKHCIKRRSQRRSITGSKSFTSSAM